MYTGPKLEFENGKYSITQRFIKDMINWFKDGKTIPKRYVWEIVLGAHEHFVKSDSLVDIDLEAGVTCDVIGDIHGELGVHLSSKRTTDLPRKANSMTCYTSFL
jgi:serine/threonine-protein phosphatase 5